MSRAPDNRGSLATAAMETAAYGTQPQASPDHVGGWRIHRRLGAGAMGEVYLAERDGQMAALKLVAKDRLQDDAFIQRFHREMAALLQFDHPHVARAFDRGEHNGQPWLAMEFVDGPDVESVLKQNNSAPFPEVEVLQFAIQVARGLEHVHRQTGLIHRDIKPANVLIARAPGGDPRRLLNPGDTVKVIDFGLAKPTEQGEGLGLTMTGMIMGTPNYIAPEQVACERTLSLHVDMYSLAASMFHLLTGRLPFPMASAAAVMVAHLNQAAPDPGSLQPGLTALTRKLVLTAMAKRSAERYADWRAFIHACEQSLAACPSPPGTGSRAFPKRPPAPAEPPTSKVAEPPTASGRGSDALRAAVTSRIHRRPVGIKPDTGSVHVEAPAQDPARGSAVQRWSGRLEASGSTGGSILPWIILGIAVLLSAAGVVLAILE